VLLELEKGISLGLDATNLRLRISVAEEVRMNNNEEDEERNVTALKEASMMMISCKANRLLVCK
jgi:hypothetical protein